MNSTLSSLYSSLSSSSSIISSFSPFSFLNSSSSLLSHHLTPVLKDLFPFPLSGGTVFDPLLHGDILSFFNNFLSVRYWLNEILQQYEREPGHVLLELLCVLIIIYLLIRKPYDPDSLNKLTKKEENELIKEWKSEPLVPNIPNYYKQKLNDLPVIQHETSTIMIINNKKYSNFCSSNYLNLSNRTEIKKAAKKTIERYGVGSCGPRGFYGSFDVHLEIEKQLCEFLNAPACILYSDVIACMSSVIPAFSKRGDIIIADEGVHYGIQQGLILSRSDIKYFKHNDMNDLERILKELSHNNDSSSKKHKNNNDKLIRKFIVVEGLYSNYGDICPLPDLVRLKNHYKYRVIVDDSNGIGTLGNTGRGSLEQWGLSIDNGDIDIVCGTLDTTLSSQGAYCISSHQIVDHQRLSGSGYCFSASSPPYCSSAALVSLHLLHQQSSLVSHLQLICKTFRSQLLELKNKYNLFIDIEGHKYKNESNYYINDNFISPIIHIKLNHLDIKNNMKLEQKYEIYEEIRKYLKNEYNILISVPDYVQAEISIKNKTCEPSLKIQINVEHTQQQLQYLLDSIKNTILLFQNHNYHIHNIQNNNNTNENSNEGEENHNHNNSSSNDTSYTSTSTSHSNSNSNGNTRNKRKNGTSSH